jgi:hypothetical protein
LPSSKPVRRSDSAAIKRTPEIAPGACAMAMTVTSAATALRVSKRSARAKAPTASAGKSGAANR